jgi:hypothetical protein
MYRYPAKLTLGQARGPTTVSVYRELTLTQKPSLLLLEADHPVHDSLCRVLA